MSNYCCIWGHEIGENNTTGMGAECRAAYSDALMKAIFSDNEKSLEYNWLVQVRHIKGAFLQEFGNTKFRSEFRKSFFESMKSAERVSRKQLDIMNQWIINKNGNLAESIDEDIRNEKKQLIALWKKDIKIGAAAIEVARREIRAKRKN